MDENRKPRPDRHALTRRAERLRQRLLARSLARLYRRVVRALYNLRGAAELRALGDRELHDLGLDRGGIAYACRHGRKAGRP